MKLSYRNILLMGIALMSLSLLTACHRHKNRHKHESLPVLSRPPADMHPGGDNPPPYDDGWVLPQYKEVTFDTPTADEIIADAMQVGDVMGRSETDN